jgi:dTDP-4-dehydrorhamnose reductase
VIAAPSADRYHWWVLDVEDMRTGAPSAEHPVLVLGAAGQLGEVTVARFARAWPTVGWTRRDLDLGDGPSVARAIADLHPSIIVNCAGYNDVDGAEDAAVEALEANALAVRSVARAAAAVGATFVQYSSDFVFDGETTAPYREDHRPNPRSIYAASKLMGEWFAADAPVHYVLRVESLFGGLTRVKGSLDKIIDGVQQGRAVRVFTDRVVSPSYVWDVAEATAALLRAHAAPGVYHCVNSGHASWFDVAVEVGRQLGVLPTLEATTTQEVQLRAQRPRYCALANDKLRAAAFEMPTWQDALRRALAPRTERNAPHPATRT